MLEENSPDTNPLSSQEVYRAGDHWLQLPNARAPHHSTLPGPSAQIPARQGTMDGRPTNNGWASPAQGQPSATAPIQLHSGEGDKQPFATVPRKLLGLGKYKETLNIIFGKDFHMKKVKHHKSSTMLQSAHTCE